MHRQKESFTSQSQRDALRDAYRNRTASPNDLRSFYELSASTAQQQRRAWSRYETRSYLPCDQNILSSRGPMLNPLYTALLEEFRPGKAAYGGIFSADRTAIATRYPSSAAICIRSLIKLDAQSVPILGPSIFSLLCLYYGRLHADNGLVHLARSSYSTALSQYHNRLNDAILGLENTDVRKGSWICASIALQFFEHIYQLQIYEVGHQAHFDGALRLLESSGPECVRESPELQGMFRGLGGVATFFAIHRRRPSVLSEPRWRQLGVELGSRSLRDELIDRSLDIPALLQSADELLQRLQDGTTDRAAFVDSSLHLLLKMERLQSRLVDWLVALRANTPGPLYWPRTQPLVTFTPPEDNECAPKNTTALHQFVFSAGTIAALLVMYWAFQLELLMTTLDLRRALLAHSSSKYVRSFISDKLQEDIGTASESARLRVEAQPYLECFEGFIGMQLPLRTANKYFQRSSVP